MPTEFNEAEFFSKSLSTGLRSDYRKQRNQPGLTYLTNAKPVEGIGLVPATRVNEPIPSVSVTWPFPQVFKGKSVTLLCDRTAIYEVVGNGWDLELLRMWDVSAGVYVESVAAGGQWHFIDHGDSWMLLNGTVIIHKCKRDSITGGGVVEDQPYLYTEVQAQTGCAFEGRSMLAGFTDGMTWTEAWKERWNEWAGNFPSPGGVSRNIEDFAPNFVLWSAIGGDLLWFLDEGIGTGGIIPYEFLGSDTGYNSDKPYIFDLIASNQIGWMPLPMPGVIYQLIPLGKAVIAYGSEGVCAIRPDYRDPPTFGCVRISDAGVAGRGGAGGDERGHVHVDRRGDLWEILEDLKPKRLGYREYFLPLIGETFAISVDPLEREYYISTDEECYIKTSAGLGKTSQMPTSIVVRGDDLHAVAFDGGVRSVGLVTNPFDFTFRGIKTVRTVEVGGSSFDNMFVSLYWKVGEKDTFRKSDWIPLSPDGIGHPMVSGTDFKLALMVKESVDLDLDNIMVRVVAEDMRSVRGRIGT